MNSEKSYSINFFKKVDGLGWVFESVKTNDSNIRTQLRSLIRQKRDGTVRSIDAIRLK